MGDDANKNPNPPSRAAAGSALDREYLQEAARAVDAKLPDNHGFVLLVAPFGEGENRRLTYISSMRREDAANLLKEWLIKSSGPEEWMRHIT